MKTMQLFILVTVVALFAACAAVAPQELIDARSAYQHASAGPAAQLAPAELHEANQALALAEQSFQQDPDSYKTRDLAYVAQRKSQLAEAFGVMAADQAGEARSEAAFHAKQAELVKQGKQDLNDSEMRTAAAPGPNWPGSVRSGKRSAGWSSRCPGTSSFNQANRPCCPLRMENLTR